MDPIAYKIHHNLSLGHSDILTLPSLVARVIALQAPYHEFRSSILRRISTISPCLGYLKVPHHLCELINRRSFSRRHICCGPLAHVCSTLSLHGFGVLHDTRLFPYRRLAAQQTTFVPFLSLVEATTQSLDCIPIYYEFFFILNQETQLLCISYNYLLEEWLDFNRVQHCPIECWQTRETPLKLLKYRGGVSPFSRELNLVH